MTIDTRTSFIVITADEGMVITEWKEGDDILNYSFATTQYSPLNYDINQLREITIEESDRLLEEQETKINELNEIENGQNL